MFIANKIADEHLRNEIRERKTIKNEKIAGKFYLLDASWVLKQ